MQTLVPLQPLGARATPWVGVYDEPVVQDTPLSWVRLEPVTEGSVAPNPASNRQNTTASAPIPVQSAVSPTVHPSTSVALIQELTTLTRLAESIQATSQAVTSAHSIFLDNQANALQQIEQISAVLHQIKRKH